MFIVNFVLYVSNMVELMLLIASWRWNEGSTDENDEHILYFYDLF